MNNSWEAKLKKLEEEQNSLKRMTRMLCNKSTPILSIHSEIGTVYTEDDKAEKVTDVVE